MKSREHSERRSALMVMLTEEEKAPIKNKAKEMGMTMSSYARFVLLADAKRPVAAEANNDGD